MSNGLCGETNHGDCAEEMRRQRDLLLEACKAFVYGKVDSREAEQMMLEAIAATENKESE